MALIRTRQTAELESIDLEHGDRLRSKRERVSKLAAGVSSPAGFLVFIPRPVFPWPITPSPVVEVVQTYDTFHPFPRLPGELRRMIWKKSCHSRIIEIFAYNNSLEPPPVDYVCRNPAVWSVSKEARAETEEIKKREYERIIIGQRQIFVNFDIDVFFIADSPKYGYKFNHENREWPAARIQHLIMHHTGASHRHNFLEEMENFSGSFPNLKTLSLWVNRRNIVAYCGDRLCNSPMTEYASSENVRRAEPWCSARHEDRFVEAATAEEKAQVKMEMRFFRPRFDMVKAERADWPLESFNIVFRSMAFKKPWPTCKVHKKAEAGEITAYRRCTWIVVIAILIIICIVVTTIVAEQMRAD